MPKQNPYYIPRENYKKVEEVRFWDYETKTSKLPPSVRSNIIKKYGGDYVSENREFYGPCSGSFCPHSSSFYVKISLDVIANHFEYHFLTKDSTYTTYYKSGESHDWKYFDQWAGLFSSRHKFWQTDYLIVRDDDLARKILSGLQGSGENGIFVSGVDTRGNDFTPPGSSGSTAGESECVERRRWARNILESAIRNHARGDEIDETHNF